MTPTQAAAAMREAAAKIAYARGSHNSAAGNYSPGLWAELIGDDIRALPLPPETPAPRQPEGASVVVGEKPIEAQLEILRRSVPALRHDALAATIRAEIERIRRQMNSLRYSTIDQKARISALEWVLVNMEEANG